MGRPITGDDSYELAPVERLESDAVPFWGEASNRLSAVHPEPDSTNLPDRRLLHEVSEGRANVYEPLLRHGS